MADKSYEIEIKTTSDTAGVTSVTDELRNAKEEAQETGEAVSNAMQEVSDSSADASDSIEETAEATENLNSAISDTDASPIEDVSEASQEASESTSEATENTEQLGVAITSIDPSVIDQLRDSMKEYSDSAQEGADTTNGLMEGLVSGGIATGLAGTFMGLADSAGSYNDSLLRMGLALEGHAMTVEEVTSKYGASVSKVADATGRGAGSVRNHFTNMAVAGVKSTDLLESSFQAVANGSFYSGESIESLSNKFQRISMTGMLSAKQLSSLGLTMEDLASVMGVSADEVSSKFKEMSAEQRASILSTASANKYGTEVNDVFKNSWEGLWTQLDKAKGGLERLVGELILPYLIPAVQTATTFIQGLSDTFKNLPQPVKDVLGGVLLLMGGITTLGLGLSAVMRIGKLVISPFTSIAKLFGVDLGEKVKTLASNLRTNLSQAFTSLKDNASGVATKIKTSLSSAFDTVKTKARSLATTLKSTLLSAFRSVSNFFKTSFIPALKNVGTSLLDVGKKALISGYNALKSAGMWLVDKASKLASAVANGIVTISQWALNVAMSANPITIVVLAIIALIAVLGYLYFNNEQVREAIDGLGQALLGIAQTIWDTLINAWDTLTSALQGFWDYIVGLGANLTGIVGTTSSNIINGIIGFLTWWWTLPLQIAVTFVNILAQALGFGSNFVQRMVSAGSRAVSNFFNYISQIPSKLATELGNALNKVSEWASTLPQKFWEAGVNAVKNFLNALGIHSPGIMQEKLVWEVTEMGNRIPYESRKLLSNVRQLGANIVDEFGDPSLNVSYDLNQVGNGSISSQNQTGQSQVNNFYFSDITVDDEKRMRKIVDYVAREINFNNATAGRTV